MNLMNHSNNFITLSNILKILGVIIILITVFVIGRNSGQKGLSANITNNSTETKVEAPKAKASQKLNREFVFPILSNDEKNNSFKYIVESVDIQDKILVKGQVATSVKGRTFAILNLKIINDTNQDIQFNSKGYVRLSTNNREWLAPDIHNDPVLLQAISTKYTRVGFPIDENYKNIKLQIGQIDGEKTIIDLNLK